jgi:hypothetical protein
LVGADQAFCLKILENYGGSVGSVGGVTHEQKSPGLRLTTANPEFATGLWIRKAGLKSMIYGSGASDGTATTTASLPLQPGGRRVNRTGRDGE